MTVFQYSDDKDEFVKRGNFWALMFFVLALAVGFFYFLMGSSFTLIQYVYDPPQDLHLVITNKGICT